MRKTRRNFLNLNATVTSRPEQDGNDLTHRNLSVNCLNLISGGYMKENRPSMLRTFDHCKDEIEEISDEGVDKLD